jgi:medium-chain acyl-[acyl-carrier-protein] hydrolase
MPHNPWLPYSKPEQDTLLRMFCFPYAGANAGIYRSWQEHLPPWIEVCPVELPGRGSRINEPLVTDFSTLLKDVYKGIQPYLDMKFALFGHSMGALIAYALAHLLRTSLQPGPSFLFVSGQKAPALSPGPAFLHRLHDSALIEELKRLNGTPEKILANENLMQVMLPILRADFAITETYHHLPSPALESKIIAFGGLEDIEVTRNELELWQAHTSLPVEAHMLPGDHFFIHDSQQLLLRIISRKLLQGREGRK